MNRRAALGLGTVAVTGAVAAAGTVAWADQQTDADQPEAPATTPRQAAASVRRVYQARSRQAGGTWNSYLSVADTDGTLLPAVQDNPDAVVQAYSVNKLAVATALLDKVDRGLLTLDHRADVTAGIGT